MYRSVQYPQRDIQRGGDTQPYRIDQERIEVFCLVLFYLRQKKNADDKIQDYRYQPDKRQPESKEQQAPSDIRRAVYYKQHGGFFRDARLAPQKQDYARDRIYHRPDNGDHYVAYPLFGLNKCGEPIHAQKYEHAAEHGNEYNGTEAYEKSFYCAVFHTI